MWSPCNRICAMDFSDQICIGCGRTPEEISQWFNLTDEERREIMKEIALARLKELDKRTRYKVAPDVLAATTKTPWRWRSIWTDRVRKVWIETATGGTEVLFEISEPTRKAFDRACLDAALIVEAVNTLKC